MAVARPLPRRLPRRRRDAIPLADALGFRDHGRRHALLRAALAALLLGLLAFAFVAARQLPSAQSGVLPPGRSGVVVLDLSSSINARENGAIHSALERLSSSGDRYGLVLFSDDAYEALPPGMPARELKPLLQFYEPARGSGEDARATPWSFDFRGGTRISAGLKMALEILQRDQVRKGAIVLISDLFDAASDATALKQTVLRLYDRHVKMRIVALAPGSADARFFRDVLGKQGKVTGAKGLPESAKRAPLTGAFPFWLAVCAGGLILLLGLNELLCARLAWRRAAA